MTRLQQTGEDGGRDFEFWSERLRNATSRRTQRERERERERERVLVSLWGGTINHHNTWL